MTEIRGEDLKRRTKQFSLRVIRLCETLPSKPAARIIANQLLRAATSVGANYRAACRARSPADFISKMGIVLEETDESAYWLELLVESGLVTQQRLSELLREAEELIAIFAASKITASGKRTASSA
jgi:four helix bundle protein